MTTNPNPDASKQGLPKRYKLIACEIIHREMCLLASQCENIIDVEFLRKGLHDVGQEEMSRALQQSITNVTPDTYDAILLGYGRCSNGVVGLVSPQIPLIIPRAHDCITFFFGSQAAYQKYFESAPGTYFRTTGWTERGGGDDDSLMHQLGLGSTYVEYVEKYGPDNAKFIMESIGGWEKNYKHLTYIDMGLPPDAEYARRARAEAAERNLEFRHLTGVISLLSKLLAGPWDPAEFLIVPPGQKVASDDQGDIITAEPV